jgi:hypothetical protein
LNLVSSLETFVWLPVWVFGGGGRVGFVAPFCLAEISSAAICRVTAPIEVIMKRKQSKAKKEADNKLELVSGQNRAVSSAKASSTLT